MKNMKAAAGLIQRAGRDGDTILAHINPMEANMLEAAGGSGTINPHTGLPEYSLWTKIRDAFESVAVVVGNYYLPGSSIVTSKIASKGSQKQLGSTLGQIATMGSGVAGAAAGNLANYGKLLNSVGLSAVTNGISNVSTYLSETLNTLTDGAKSFVGGNTGSTMSNLGDEAMQSVAQSGAESAGLAKETAGNLVFGKGATPPADSGSAKGLIGKAMDWAGKNPVPALMVGQTAMSTIGGVGTAEANREAAQLNRETQLAMPGVQKQAAMAPGAWSGVPQIGVANPDQVLDINGMYIRGPLAGQYAPGRGPGLISSRV